MIGFNVFVYWNFRRKLWSVRHKGKVIGHAETLSLGNSLFKVSEKGRQRVIASKYKNVHAGIQGTIAQFNAEFPVPEKNQLMTISYNPYKLPWFYDVSTLDMIENKVYDSVFLNKQGKVNIWL